MAGRLPEPRQQGVHEVCCSWPEKQCPSVGCGLRLALCLCLWLFRRCARTPKGTTMCVWLPHMVVGGSSTPGVRQSRRLLWGASAVTPERGHERFSGAGSGARAVACSAPLLLSSLQRLCWKEDLLRHEFGFYSFNGDGDTCESREVRAQGPSDQIRWFGRVLSRTTPRS